MSLVSLTSFVLFLFVGTPGDGRTQVGTPGRDRCPPRPASRAKARVVAGRWYKKAIRLYRRKNYIGAHDAFVCTNRILGAGLTKYWIARSAQDAGLVEEALALFEQLARHPPAPVTRREIQQRIAQLRKKLAALKRTPATKRARGVAAGGPVLDTGKAKSGSKVALSGRRRFQTISWALWGAGTGLLLAAVGLGTVVGLDQRAVENARDGTWWSPDLERRYARRNGLLAGTYTLMGAGLLAVAAGTALFFLGRPFRLEKISVDASPRGAGLSLSLDW